MLYSWERTTMERPTQNMRRYDRFTISFSQDLICYDKIRQTEMVGFLSESTRSFSEKIRSDSGRQDSDAERQEADDVLSESDEFRFNPAMDPIGIPRNRKSETSTWVFKNVQRFLAGSFTDLNAVILLGFTPFLVRIRQGIERIPLNACNMFSLKVLTRSAIKQSRILFLEEKPLEDWEGSWIQLSLSISAQDLAITERRDLSRHLKPKYDLQTDFAFWFYGYFIVVGL